MQSSATSALPDLLLNLYAVVHVVLTEKPLKPVATGLYCVVTAKRFRSMVLHFCSGMSVLNSHLSEMVWSCRVTDFAQAVAAPLLSKSEAADHHVVSIKQTWNKTLPVVVIMWFQPCKYRATVA